MSRPDTVIAIAIAAATSADVRTVVLRSESCAWVIGCSSYRISARDEAEGELKRAIVELRELARGIHPAILTEAGLGPALESLADHSPVAVSVESDLDGRRLPPAVEGTAYFVAAEALTNAAKHASASRVSVTATVTGGWLQLVIADDGISGADPARGTGLRGLSDRVAALSGRLRIEEASSGGTRLEVEIPCE